MKNRENTYINRIKQYNKFHEKLQKYYTVISHLRSISFILSIFTYFAGRNLEPSVFYYSLSIIFLFIFIAGVIIHNKLSIVINKVKTLLIINQEGLLRIQNNWADFPLTGDEFLDSSLPHLTDLNILGKNSLFQMIQLTSTSRGAKQLAEWLSFCKDFSTIPHRQQAVKEIRSRISMRQHLLMEGRILGKTLNPDRFLEWVKSPSFLTNNKWVVVLQRILVSSTLFFIGLHYFLDIPPFWIVGVFIQTIVFLVTIRKCHSHYMPALNRDSLFLSYEGMFKLLEGVRFETEYLKNLKSKLRTNNKSISWQMKKLQRINSSLCLCYSSFYFPMNILLLWDIYFLNKLEQWKEDMGPSIETFFDILGEMEALSSIAGFSYDNPKYVFPIISHEGIPLLAEDIAHPLIPEREKVCNSFKIPSEGFVGLITGSNMSGKSTFIRTIGINLILAFAGATVVAQKFTARPCVVMTCIGTHDSLSDHISHFYAEVKRIKTIFNAIYPQGIEQSSMPICYLIDEIFSGTNTKERFIASEGVILKLAESKSYGLLTTHDLDLGALEVKCHNINNYHFQDGINENGKIYFSYRINNGLVRSTNALKILKIMGLDFFSAEKRGC